MPDPEPKNLNPLEIFAGFIPWIVFTVVDQRLAADGVAWSALLAAVISLVFVVQGRRKGTPTLLDVYSLILSRSTAASN